MPTNVIDTNVLAAANGKADHVEIECRYQSGKLLKHIIDTQSSVSIDDEGEIFREYRSHASMSGQPREGDAFLKWLYENFGRCCELVDISEMADDEIPNGFDRSDYKFLKVAALTARPPATIHNATDNEDWPVAFDFMNERGVLFNQVC